MSGGDSIGCGMNLITITEARELEWQEQVTQKKKSKERRPSRGDYSSDEDEERQPPLAIEASREPGSELPWLPHYQQARDPIGRTGPENPIPGISGLNLVPETYSTNV